MKNSVIKIAAIALLGAVMPICACAGGGTDMNVKSRDDVEIVQDCPDGDCPSNEKGCPDCKGGEKQGEGKEGENDEEKPHFNPPHKGGGRHGRRRGRIVRPIPDPIEDQPK